MKKQKSRKCKHVKDSEHVTIKFSVEFLLLSSSLTFMYRLMLVSTVVGTGCVLVGHWCTQTNRLVLLILSVRLTLMKMDIKNKVRVSELLSH